MKQSLIAIALTMSVTIGVSAQAPDRACRRRPEGSRWASYPILRDGHEDETSPVESKAA
ncbi:MAG TPA: hypothetical protein VIZ32_21205 [Vicinamibacterales bacterium]